MKKIFLILFILCWARVLCAAPATRTIIVFPFENRSASSSVGWISEAFAEVMSRRMEGPGRLVLGREECNAASKQLGIPPDAALTLASEYMAAQTLGVDWVVTGNFQVEGQRLSAEAQLLDVQNLKLYPPLEETDILSNLTTVETRLVWRLLAGHDPNFTSDTEQNFAARFPPIRLDAFENYIRGILANNGAAKANFLTTAFRLDPSSHNAAYSLGRYYFQQKDYANSALWLSKLDAADPNYLSSLFLSGVDNFFLGRDKEAEDDFSALSRQMPLNEVWNNLGVLAARRNDYATAQTDFSRAYHGDPSDADYSFNLGASYAGLDQFDEAVKYLQRAAAKDENDLGVHTLLAYAMSKAGDTTGSKDQLSWVASHDGKAMADLNDGILPQPRLKKRYNGAAFRLLSAAVHNSIEAVLAKEPLAEQGRFHLERGEEYIQQRRVPEAIRELEEASSLIPENGAVHLFLGEAYEAAGKHEQA
ncbi:MAG: tetratricopeptide repeat protein, partial [Acidobacteriota bacterium]|nr:tetratricopeptide repeat protein [Acidobacteriota bacterium]